MTASTCRSARTSRWRPASRSLEGGDAGHATALARTDRPAEHPAGARHASAAWCRATAIFPSRRSLPCPRSSVPRRCRWPPPPPGEPPLRPLFLFDPPQPVEVIAEVPDGPPHRFRWRRKLHEVRLYEGPERIAAEWWRRKGGRGCRQGRADPRLLPGRGCARAALLDFPPRALRRKARSRAGICTGCSHERSSPPLPNWSPRPITASCAAPRIRRTWSRGRSALGMAGIGIADRNSVAGVVRAHVAWREAWRAAAERLPAGRRRAAGLCRWHAGHHRLSRHAPWLGAADPAADHGQPPRRKGRLHPASDRICSIMPKICC